MEEKKPKHEVMTTDAGRPVATIRIRLTVGPRGPVVFEDFPAVRKNGAFQPRTHPRTRRPRQRLRRSRAFRLHQRGNHEVHHRQTIFRSRQEDPHLHPLLDGRRRKRLCRYRARPARLRAEVLHRRRQLGHDRQQHARLLHSRSAEVRRFHSHAEARPANQPEVAHHDVGFLVALAGIAASGHHPVLRSRHARRLSPHERLQQPHLQPDQRQERALLREVALQNQARHQEFHRRGRQRAARH